MKRDKRENKVKPGATRPAYLVLTSSAPLGLEKIKKEKNMIIEGINSNNSLTVRKGKLPPSNDVIESENGSKRYRMSTIKNPLLQTKRMSTTHEIMLKKWPMEEQEIKQLSSSFREDSSKRTKLLQRYREFLEGSRKEKEQQASRQMESYFEDEGSSSEMDVDELASDDLKEEKQVRKIIESFTKTNSKAGMNWLKAYNRNMQQKNANKEKILVSKVQDLQEATARYEQC